MRRMPPVYRQGTDGKPAICPVCEIRARLEHSFFCFECGKFLLHKPQQSARRKAMERARCFNPPGFRCYYTGRLLELYDENSPHYASFDHRTPGDKWDLVMCERWVNSFKGPMSEKEFWPIVLALDDWHFKRIPFLIEIVKIAAWHGNKPRRDRRRKLHFPLLPLRECAEFCDICGAKPLPRSKYCARCAAFYYRGGENLARAAAMKRACRNRVFYCEYTGLPMELEDTESPRYMEFHHPVPGKKGNLRAVVAFVNRMMTDLSEDDFWTAVHEFARIRREGGEFKAAMDFKYWRRKAKRLTQKKKKMALKEDKLIEKIIEDTESGEGID
jgi:hypothetical protein